MKSRYYHNVKQIRNKISSKVVEQRKERHYKNPRALAEAITKKGDPRNLDAIYKAVRKIERPDKHELDPNWMPPLTDLLWICEALNCDINFLLGAIERPNQHHHDIGTYTGLSDQAIDTLHARCITKSRHSKLMPLDDTTNAVVPFLDFFISSDDSIRLLSVLGFERTNRQTIQRIKKNKNKYRTVKTAFDNALSSFGLSETDGFYQLPPRAKGRELLDEFVSNLSIDLKLYKDDPDDGAFHLSDETPKVNAIINECFGMDAAHLLDALLCDYESLDTDRKIENAFMRIVHEYFNEGVK